MRTVASLAGSAGGVGFSWPAAAALNTPARASSEITYFLHPPSAKSGHQLHAPVSCSEYAHASLLPVACQPAESKTEHAAGKHSRPGGDHHGAQRSCPDDLRGGRRRIFHGVPTEDDGAPSLADPLVQGVQRRCPPFLDHVDRSCSSSGNRHSYLQVLSRQEARHVPSRGRRAFHMKSRLATKISRDPPLKCSCFGVEYSVAIGSLTWRRAPVPRAGNAVPTM